MRSSKRLSPKPALSPGMYISNCSVRSCTALLYIFVLHAALSGALAAQNVDVGEAKTGSCRHADPGKQRGITEEEKTRGFALSSRPWLKPVFANSNVSADSPAAPVLKAFAARGEYEPVTFAVHALKDLTNVTVTVGELTAANGEKILTDNLQVSEVRCLPRRLSDDEGDRIDGYPSFLELTDRTDLETGQTVRFWITLHVPEDTEKGTYVGNVSISAGGARAVLSLEVTVYHFDLPRARIRHGMALGGSAYERLSVEDKFPEVFRDMKEHGITSVCVGGPRLREIRMKGPSVAFEFGGNSGYSDCMNAIERAGIPGPVLIADSLQAYAAVKTTAVSPELRIRFLTQGHHSKVWEEMREGAIRLNPDFGRLYSNGVAELVEKHEREEWPSFWIVPRRKYLNGKEGLQGDLAQLLGFLREAKGVKTGVLAAYAEKNVKQLSESVDTVVLAGGVSGQDIVKELHQNGKRIKIYGVDTRAVNPEVMRYAAGYYLWVNGLDGMEVWEYQRTFGSAYDDMDGEWGDTVFHYPEEGNEIGGPAIAWEAYREGIDDYRYLQALLETLKWAKGSEDNGLAKRGARVEKELKKRLGTLAHLADLSRAAKWDDIRIGGDGRKTYIGQLKLPNGWKIEEYDDMRRWVAEQIVELEFGK